MSGSAIVNAELTVDSNPARVSSMITHEHKRRVEIPCLSAQSLSTPSDSLR